jgi:hypothetical protein
MICLVKDETIVVPPVPLGDPSIRQAFFIAGYTEVSGVLTDPTGYVPPALPIPGPEVPVDMGSGYKIFPVIVEPSNPPDGQVLVGWTDTVGLDAVTRSPVYGPSPQQPTLAEQKATWLKQLMAAINTYAEKEYPPLKREAIRLSIPPYDGPEQEAYSVFLQETLGLQATMADQIDACASPEELSALIAALKTEYSQYLT